jgi:hypothetical protein
MFTGMGLAKQFINNRLGGARNASTLLGSATGAAYGGMSADRGEGWSGAAMGAGFGAGLGRYGSAALRGGKRSANAFSSMAGKMGLRTNNRSVAQSFGIGASRGISRQMMQDFRGAKMQANRGFNSIKGLF